MPEFVIYEDESKKANVDPVTGKPAAPWWTFSVDGQPSGKFYPNRYGCERCIDRLKKGRSSEAFGDWVDVVQDGRVVARGLPRGGRKEGRARVTAVPPAGTAPTYRTVKGGAQKPVEPRPTFRAEVDDEHLGDFATEAEARAACAVRSFMTRGKLSLVGKKMTTPDGTEAVVSYDGRNLTGVCTSGKRWAVGYAPDGNHRVKALPVE